MYRFASLSLIVAIVLAILGFTNLAGDFAGLALGLFAVSLISSMVFAGMGALNARDMRRCYN